MQYNFFLIFERFSTALNESFADSAGDLSVVETEAAVVGGVGLPLVEVDTQQEGGHRAAAGGGGDRAAGGAGGAREVLMRGIQLVHLPG